MRLPSVIAPGPRLRIFAAATIMSAAVISFVSIKHLAEYAGFGEFSWLFPLTLDAVAAFGMDLWVRQSPAWRQARALALVAILGSLVSNIADHWITQRSVLPAVLGAVPPAMLAALLAVLHRHSVGTAVVRGGPDKAVRDAIWSALGQSVPVPRTNAGPATYVVPVRLWSPNWSAFEGPAVGPMVRARIPAPIRTEFADRVLTEKLAHAVREDRTAVPPKQRTVQTTGPGDDVIVKEIRANHATGGIWPTKRDVMTEHKIGSGRALRLLALAKEETGE